MLNLVLNASTLDQLVYHTARKNLHYQKIGTMTRKKMNTRTQRIKKRRVEQRSPFIQKTRKTSHLNKALRVNRMQVLECLTETCSKGHGKGTGETDRCMAKILKANRNQVLECQTETCIHHGKGIIETGRHLDRAQWILSVPTDQSLIQGHQTL